MVVHAYKFSAREEETGAWGPADIVSLVSFRPIRDPVVDNIPGDQVKECPLILTSTGMCMHTHM